MREDTHTTTPTDAGTYDQSTHGHDYDYDDDRPALADVADDAADDAYQAQRRRDRAAAAHARGDYYPTDWDTFAANALTFVLRTRGTYATVVPVRDNVFRVDPGTTTDLDAIVVAVTAAGLVAQDPMRSGSPRDVAGLDVQIHKGAVWARRTAAHVAAHDFPPF